MNSDKVLKQHELSEGLVAKVHDCSSHYFGGYYHVRMQVTADVPLLPEYFASESEFEDAVKSIGPTVCFSRILERMAVPGIEQDTVRYQLLDTFEANLLPYMRRPDFGRSFVASEYGKALKRKANVQTRWA